MLDVRNGGYWGYFPLEPTPPNTRSGPFPHFDPIPASTRSTCPIFGRYDRNRNVTAATLTRYADNFAGKAHEFKFGFEFERSKIRNESGYPGGRYYYDYGGAPYPVRCGTATSPTQPPSGPRSTRRTRGPSTIV